MSLAYAIGFRHNNSILTKSLHGVLAAALRATFPKGLSHVTFHAIIIKRHVLQKMVALWHGK